MENKELVLKEQETEKALALKETVAQEQEGLSINTKNAELIKDNLEKLNTIAETIKAALIEGLDYGIIPGVQKPSLFKPGAEKIALMYGLTQEYELLEHIRDRENAIILYRFKAMLFNGSGKQIAEGYGLCSSEERKYAKQNPYDIENTLMKMAKKRALVDAAISIGVLSQVFTQDVEDLKLGKASGVALSKTDKWNLYSLIYDTVLIDFKESFKTNKDFKEAAKAFIPELLTRANTENKNFMAFTTADRAIFLDYINNPENLENEKAKFKAQNKLQ